MIPVDEASRLPRVPFTRQLRVRAMGVPVSNWRMWASNLSKGGMFIRSAEPFAVGTRLRFSLESAEHFMDLGEGEVVWRRPLAPKPGPDALPGFGIRFLRLDQAAQPFLAAVINHGGISSSLAPRSEPAAAPLSEESTTEAEDPKD